MKDDFAYAKETFGVEIVLTVSDDGPDGKKMRRLVDEDPELTTAALECWAHQSHLMTGNYLSVKAGFMLAAEQAGEVIKWFNNHSKALDTLRGHQTLIRGKPLALVLPAATRWTTQYTSLHRLKTQEAAVVGCVAQYRDELLLAGGPRADAKAKALEVINICRDPEFWTNLQRYHILYLIWLAY